MLNRREVLAIGAGIAISQIPNFAGRPIHAGWLQEAARSVKRRPFFFGADRFIKGTGQGKRVLLWKYFEHVTGEPFKPHVQEVGDCVGQSCALGVDTLTAVQIALHGLSEQWRAKCCVEAIYGGSRIEIAKGAPCFDRRGRPTDGTCCSWAGEYVRRYGVLLRGRYGEYDLTNYNSKLSRKFGSFKVGVPDELEAISTLHPVRTVTPVTSWPQACDFIANGYPIFFGSSIGFRMETDSEGFLLRGTEDWHHSMLLWGIDTISRRKGGCIANSWGDRWLAGRQHALGAPAGCFWADADAINDVLTEGDAYALSNYVGYPYQPLDYRFH